MALLLVRIPPSYPWCPRSPASQIFVWCAALITISCPFHWIGILWPFPWTHCVWFPPRTLAAPHICAYHPLPSPNIVSLVTLWSPLSGFYGLSFLNPAGPSFWMVPSVPAYFLLQGWSTFWRKKGLFSWDSRTRAASDILEPPLAIFIIGFLCRTPESCQGSIFSFWESFEANNFIEQPWMH